MDDTFLKELLELEPKSGAFATKEKLPITRKKLSIKESVHDLLMATPGLARKILRESFPDHAGRPGMVGGSLPRSGGGGSVNGEKLSAPAPKLIPPPALTPEQEEEARRLTSQLGDGFSYNPISVSEKTPPNDGYMVSIEEYGEKFTLGNLTIDQQFEKVRNFIIKHKEQLLKPHNFFGGWKDGDTYWFDISVPIKDAGQAVRMGIINHQAGIWDLKNQRTVDLRLGKLSEAWRQLWQKKRNQIRS